MACWLQKISSCTEGENDEMGIPNSRERSRLNNLKSRMLFTCKNFVFRLYIEKKLLLQKMVASPSYSPSPYGSVKVLSFSRYLIFFLTFWSGRKNGLIRKIRLISKLMTSQPG